MGLILDYIDGQSPLDEEEREGLKINSIATRHDLDEFEQQNIEEAIEWVMKQNISVDRFLAEEFVRELHFRMFGSVWTWAGKFRKSGKTVGVDWVSIPIELKKLLDDCRYWLDNEIFSEEETAVRLKHRLVYIHPFPNGNGRHSRLMADVLMEKVFHKPIFTWGGENLDSIGDIRSRYIQAIREADNGNYLPLLEFAKS
ncbi:MAG: mobile mystery protein B [Patescibacteria group bacterium]|jgi:Fic-DOC domain mobile mystery protein B